VREPRRFSIRWDYQTNAAGKVEGKFRGTARGPHRGSYPPSTTLFNDESAITVEKGPKEEFHRGHLGFHETIWGGWEKLLKVTRNGYGDIAAVAGGTRAAAVAAHDFLVKYQDPRAEGDRHLRGETNTNGYFAPLGDAGRDFEY